MFYKRRRGTFYFFLKILYNKYFLKLGNEENIVKKITNNITLNLKNHEYIIIYKLFSLYYRNKKYRGEINFNPKIYLDFSRTHMKSAFTEKSIYLNLYNHLTLYDN